MRYSPLVTRPVVPGVLPALLCAALLAFGAGSLARADDKQPKDKDRAKPAETPMAAAKAYTGMMKTGKGAEAVQTYWDMATMLSGIFGEHLEQHSDAERKEMHDLLRKVMGKINSNPKVIEMMSRATITDFKEEKSETEDDSVVTFVLKVDGKEIPNTLQFRRGKRGWLITDAGVRGKMMVAALREQYTPNAKDLTPLQFIRDMAEQFK